MVSPGAEVTVLLLVANTGSVVDQFSFQPLGQAASWTSVGPASVSLFPQTEQTVQVTFRPPRVSTTAAGPIPFAIRVVSAEDPTGSVVEEGVVVVEAFSDVTSELVPRTTKGRAAARQELAVDNRGNVRVNATLGGVDPDNALTFAFDPPGVAVEPGTAQFAKIRVTPHQRFWRGQPKTLPYQVLVTEEGREPVAVDGAIVQEAMLPRWFWKAVLGLAAVLVALLLWWFLLLKPTVRSTAKDAVDDGFVAAGITTTTAAPEGAGNADGGGAGGGAPGGDPGGGGAGGGGATTTAAPATTTPATTTTSSALSPLGEPVDFRLAAAAVPGSAAVAERAAPGVDKTLSITDLVLQNPQGDSGRIEIRRGDTILLESALENFRDLDYHFVSPYQVKAPDTVSIRLTCLAPGGNQAQCRVAVSFAGFEG